MTADLTNILTPVLTREVKNCKQRKKAAKKLLKFLRKGQKHKYGIYIYICSAWEEESSIGIEFTGQDLEAALIEAINAFMSDNNRTDVQGSIYASIVYRKSLKDIREAFSIPFDCNEWLRKRQSEKEQSK